MATTESVTLGRPLKKILEAAVNAAESLSPRGADRRFTHTYQVAASDLNTIGDKTQFIFLPAGFFITHLEGRWSEAGDTNVSPTLVFDVITETTAGVADTLKIVTGSTSAQDGDTLGFRSDAGALPAYAGDRYLSLNVTTAAATAAAADLRLTVGISYGINQLLIPSLSLQDV